MGYEVYILAFVIFSLILYFLPRKWMWIAFLFYFIAFSYLSYCYVPSYQDDLARYYRHFRHVWDMSFSDLMNKHLHDSATPWQNMPVAAVVFYIASRFRDYKMLACVTGIITGISIFLPIYKVAKKYEAKKMYVWLACLILFSVFRYTYAISGVRNIIAVGLFCISLYYEQIEKKNKILCWAGYVASALTHQAGLLYLVFRILIMFRWKKFGYWLTFLRNAIIAIGFGFVQLNSSGSNDYFSTVAEKTKSYNQKGLYRQITLGTVILLLEILIIYAIIIYFKKYYDKSIMGYYDTFINMTTIGFFLIYNKVFIERVMYWSVPMCAAILMIIGFTLRDRKRAQELQALQNRPDKKYLVQDSYFGSNLKFIIVVMSIIFTIILFRFTNNRFLEFSRIKLYNGGMYHKQVLLR